jgi:hypothetical protein
MPQLIGGDLFALTDQVQSKTIHGALNDPFSFIDTLIETCINFGLLFGLCVVYYYLYCVF